MGPIWPLPRKLLKLGAGASASPGARLRDEAAPFSEALLQFASQGISEGGTFSRLSCSKFPRDAVEMDSYFPRDL